MFIYRFQSIGTNTRNVFLSKNRRKRAKTFIVHRQNRVSRQKKTSNSKRAIFLPAPSSFSLPSHRGTVSNRDVSSLGYLSLLSLLPKWLYGDYTFIGRGATVTRERYVTTPRRYPWKTGERNFRQPVNHFIFFHSVRANGFHLHCFHPPSLFTSNLRKQFTSSARRIFL